MFFENGGRFVFIQLIGDSAEFIWTWFVAGIFVPVIVEVSGMFLGRIVVVATVAAAAVVSSI